MVGPKTGVALAKHHSDGAASAGANDRSGGDPSGSGRRDFVSATVGSSRAGSDVGGTPGGRAADAALTPTVELSSRTPPTTAGTFVPAVFLVGFYDRLQIMDLRDIHPMDAGGVQRREDFDSASEAGKRESVERDSERAKLEKQKSFQELAAEYKDDPKKKELYEKAFAISRKISEKGGIALAVGGFARDSVMKSLGYALDPKDLDIEVYGLEMPVLRGVLAELGEVNTVGQAFGVMKLGDLDISIPRRDSKTSEGHKGFEVKGDPKMLLKEAARRRDLTINTLALNPLTGEVVDVFGGIDDILNKKLRATDPETFAEDPLRVLRVMQFAGRFGFNVEEKTREICRGLVRSGALNELPMERFEEEWKKLMLKSAAPSRGLEVARELEIVAHYPELKALIGCEQEYDWHPEGDVWTHTLMVVDEAKKIAQREQLDNQRSLVLLFSALCHDLGKPGTTKVQEVRGVERITAHGHEEAGILPAAGFLKSINIPKEMIDEITPLVAYHLFPTKYDERVTDAAVRRLAKKIAPASIQDLIMLGEADVHGRGVWIDQPHASRDAKAWNGYESGKKLLAHAERLPDISATSAKTVKYITGKRLIELGLSPKLGGKFGAVLNELEHAQEEDKITSPDDLRLAKLFVFLANVENNDQARISEKLLTGESMTKEEMVREVKDRFLEIGTHDMGTLVMTLLMEEKPLPASLEQNKIAILTAHKYGPAWFKHFDKSFYDGPWKSFYGQFEVDEEKQKALAKLDFEEQLQMGVRLIIEPDRDSIIKYQESYEVKPEEQSGKSAYYVTNLYPFEAGMLDGFEIMVQYIPDMKRICISVMNEDPRVVEGIDRKIRDAMPEFENAKKVGYLFASNKNGEDNVYTEEDGKSVYRRIVELIGSE
jgi:tRNA nucleotidyltransferase (CCA-adding enzyme)